MVAFRLTEVLIVVVILGTSCSLGAPSVTNGDDCYNNVGWLAFVVVILHVVLNVSGTGKR